MPPCEPVGDQAEPPSDHRLDACGGGSRRALSEWQVVAMATVAWIGARLALPIPSLPGVMLLGLGLAGRRKLPLIIGVGLLACSLGHRSVEGFRPVQAAAFAGRVAVIDQPRASGLGWRVDVRLDDGRRVEASGFGHAGFELSVLSAGDTIYLEGRLRPVPDQPWTRARHLLGRLSVDEAASARGPTGPRAIVEVIRDGVANPSRLVPEDVRALYLGLVIGDDGRQSPAQRERFRASGLSHLQAVSGQNVAFVLAVVRPASSMLGRRSRLAVAVAVLLAFALATRLEPSVLRATTTAGLAALASFEGRRQSGLRLLGLAVTALVLVDPFLVYSVGFRLSVAASVGILVVTPALVDRLRVPAFMKQPLGVTLGAQLAVSPLLIATFGSVPAASIPANLLAGWAAGAVMVLGLTVGPLAQFLGGRLGQWLQLPSAWLLRWIDGVASWGSAVPAPVLGPTSGPLILVLLALTWALWGRAGPSRSPTRKAAIMAAATFALGASFLATPRQLTTPAGGFVSLEGGGSWHSLGGGRPSILIVHGDANERLLASLIESRVGRIDVVVSGSGNGHSAFITSEIMSLRPTGVVLAPSLHRIIGATRVTGDLSLVLDPERPIEVHPDGPNRLTVLVDGQLVDWPGTTESG